MSTEDLQKKTDAELERLLRDDRSRLADLKFRLPAGEVKDTSEFRKRRQEIARILTIRRHQRPVVASL